MSETLLPCPFCGGEAEEWTPSLVHCVDCSAENDAENWNRRPAPAREWKGQWKRADQAFPVFTVVPGEEWESRAEKMRKDGYTLVTLESRTVGPWEKCE